MFSNKFCVEDADPAVAGQHDKWARFNLCLIHFVEDAETSSASPALNLFQGHKVLDSIICKAFVFLQKWN